MMLLRLGRLKLWYNSFYRTAFAVPLLFSAAILGVTSYLPCLLVFIAGMTLNYYYTSAVNYISDIEEDSLKPKLGDKWDRLDDPANPLTTRDMDNLEAVFKEVLLIYGILSAAVLLAAYITMPTGMFLIYTAHHAVLFLAATLYSVGPRLKESASGFLIASMLYWYPSLAMTTVFLHSTWLPMYTAAILLIGVQESLEHTLHHHSIDEGAGRRTLAVRFGKVNVSKAARVVGLFSYIAMSFLAWEIWPPLASLPLLLLVAWATTGLRYWRIYIAGLYIYLVVVMYPPQAADIYMLGVILGVPLATSVGEAVAMFRQGVVEPIESFAIRAYHEIFSAAHRAAHALKKS